MSETSSKTYYELLGLAPDATKEEIREAYREIARIYHPDSNFYDEILGEVNLPKGNIERFKEITAAYHTLVNDEKRREYDKLIPKGLRGWESEELWTAVHEHHVTQRAEGRPMASGTFGRFGRLEPEEPLVERGEEIPEPLSALVRRRRSLWGRILTAIGL